MFHKFTGQVLAITTLLCLSAHPMNSYANGLTSPAAQTQLGTQLEPAHMAPETKTALLEGLSFDDMRQGTRTKLSETRKWVKGHKAVDNAQGLIQNLEHATDRFQTRVAPVGRSIRTSLNGNLPGKSLAQRGDKTFSVFGLLLMMAFGLVLILMGLSGPASRLGGRH